VFEGRVVGAKGVAQALVSDDLPVPQCIIVLMGITPSEESVLSAGDGLLSGEEYFAGNSDPDMTVQLSALIGVANAPGDDRGQGAAEDLFDAFIQLRNALHGWTPGNNYAPISMDALTLDGETYNRSRAWAQVDFNTTAPLSALV